MKNLRIMGWVLAAGLGVGLAGCTTPKLVTVTTTPDSADITVNGVPSGRTPYRSTLTFSGKMPSYAVTVRKEGFKETNTTIYLDPRNQTEYHLNLDKIEEVSLELATVETKKTAEGAKLELLRFPTLAYLEVIERSPNVASVTRVTSNEDPNSQIGSPVLSPTSDKLVFQYIVLEGTSSWYSNIKKMDVGGVGQTILTYGKWTDIDPCFDASGNVVVFSSDRTSPNKTLYRVNAESAGGITRITSTSAEDYGPSVASSGKVIAYVSLPPRAEESQIWTIPWDGNLVTQLREGESPCISPDGKKILFTRRDKIRGDKQLWVMNIDGTGETQLTQNTDPSDAAKVPGSNADADLVQNIQGRWSPDGKWIVYASNVGRDSKGRRNFDIWLMAADGSSRTQLTTNGSWDDSPCWDYKGECIYFRSNRGGAWNIWRFKPVLN